MTAPWQPMQQVLPEPVTNYYKGKAIRQDLATAKKQEQLLDMEIESAPSKMAAAIAKAKLDEENIRQQMAKRGGEITDADLARRREVYGPIYEEAQKDIDNIDLTKVSEQMLSAAELMGPEEVKNYKNVVDRNKDGVLSYDEFAASGVVYGIQQEASDRTPQKFIDKNGNPVQGSMDKQGRYYDSSGTQRTDITPIAPALAEAPNI